MSVEGKVAIVTGAAGGIGLAIAKLLVKQGAKVVFTDIQASGAERIQEVGDTSHFICHDVSIASEWEAAVKETEERYGSISILVNNAGIVSSNAPIDSCTEEHYRKVIEVNQIGVYLGMKAVVASMKRAGGGSIVNTSSALGLVAVPGSFAYVASKFAVTGMTKAAALELGKYGIRVNSIHPGAIKTTMMDATIDSDGNNPFEQFAQTLPISRVGKPEEMAEVVAFLASDAASYCTGAAFVADGGWTTS